VQATAPTLTSLKSPAVESDHEISLAAILDAHPEPVVHLSADGRVLYLNPSARDAFGMELDVGSTPWSELIDAVTTGAKASGVEEPTLRLGGRCFGLTVRATNDGATLYFRETTSQELAAASARATEQSYWTLVELLPLAVVIYQQRRVIFANPAALRLFGASAPAALLGVDIFERVHVCAPATVPVEPVPADARAPWCRVRVLRLDGLPVLCEASEIESEHQGRPAMAVVMRYAGRPK
jgi:PAS domain-containing protein